MILACRVFNSVAVLAIVTFFASSAAAGTVYKADLNRPPSVKKLLNIFDPPPKRVIKMFDDPQPEQQHTDQRVVNSVDESVVAVPESANSVSAHIEFATNSASVPHVAYQFLAQMSSAMEHQRLRNRRLIIEGHTDAVGSDAYNQRLSQLRAESVKNYILTHSNVDSERLVAIGFGERMLKKHIQGPEKENRRVEFRMENAY